MEFAGLAASQAGLYVVRFQLPEDVMRGSSISLVVRVAGVESNTTYIAIEEQPAPETPAEGQQP